MTFLLVRQFLSYDRLHLQHVPIDVNPRVGGGSDPGEFDIFTRARVKFPTPGLLENVKFPPLGTAFCPKQVVAISNSRPQGRSRMSKSPPREKLAESISRGYFREISARLTRKSPWNQALNKVKLSINYTFNLIKG